LRGTAATTCSSAGMPIRVIAEILAWSEDEVERIIRRYVARARLIVLESMPPRIGPAR
jgi:hypothetical protein